MPIFPNVTLEKLASSYSKFWFWSCSYARNYCALYGGDVNGWNMVKWKETKHVKHEWEQSNSGNFGITGLKIHEESDQNIMLYQIEILTYDYQFFYPLVYLFFKKKSKKIIIIYSWTGVAQQFQTSNIDRINGLNFIFLQQIRWISFQ